MSGKSTCVVDGIVQWVFLLNQDVQDAGFVTLVKIYTGGSELKLYICKLDFACMKLSLCVKGLSGLLRTYKY